MNTPIAVSPAPTSRTAFSRVRIVLCQTSHPGNIGSAARALKTMGFSRLVLVRPRHRPEEQAIALAAGATDVLDNAQIVESLSEALAGTRHAVALTARRRELAVAPLWAREAAGEMALTLGDPDAEVALVFGNESAGLSNEELSLCSRWAMIPANPEFSSLNVASAVQLMCYELRLAVAAPGAPPAVPDAGEIATHEDVERLLTHLQQVAVESEFLDPANPKRFMVRMRRAAARARLEREEVAIFRGLLSAVEKPFK
ncbi:MAG: RNA methyltransferase [Rhodocyclaceae bacterium]|nr:RNA methyltransferase [Rhodocyclaceae bacterium]